MRNFVSELPVDLSTWHTVLRDMDREALWRTVERLNRDAAGRWSYRSKPDGAGAAAAEGGEKAYLFFLERRGDVAIVAR